ncbi:MAG: hypothetical protein FWH33_01270 [Oscillospiraceae bacterium]|nr:hypothetical protein [Oscillospiraceae bacterium]
MRVDHPDIIKDVLTTIRSEYGFNHNRYIRDSLVFWLMGSGVHLYNMSEIKNSDIDREKKLITVNGTEYQIIDDEVLRLIDEWSKCVYVESERFGPVYLADGEYLFRPTVVDALFEEKSSSGVFIAAIRRISEHYFDATGKRITMTSMGVTMPGVFSDVVEIIEIE